MIIDNKGEMLAEALITFCVISLSTIILLCSVVTSNKLIENGKKIENDIRSEKVELKTFLQNERDSNKTKQLEIVVNNKHVFIDGLLFYETDINKFKGFRK